MKKITLLLSLLMMSGCAGGIPTNPQGFQMREAQTEHFSLPVWEKAPLESGKVIRFYITDNGNPTPAKPTVLKLAAKDSFKNIVVISRPCQYAPNKLCSNKKIYGSAQYNPEIIKEIEEVVAYYIQKYNAKGIEFVAYGGAAPIAFGIGSGLNNVRQIITIAGILDLDGYVNKHNLPDFDKEAVNPIKMVNRISQIPQVHFVGGKDESTTQGMTERFVSKLQNPRSAIVKVAPDMGHTGWEDLELGY